VNGGLSQQMFWKIKGYFFVKWRTFFKSLDQITRFSPKFNNFAKSVYLKFFKLETFTLSLMTNELKIPNRFIYTNQGIQQNLVLVDAQCLQSGSYHRGIGRYSRKLLIQVAQICPEKEFVLLLNNIKDLKNIVNFIDEIPSSVSNLLFTLPKIDSHTKDLRLVDYEKLLTEYAIQLKPQSILFLSIFEHPYDVVRLDILKFQNTFALFYDLIPLEFPKWFLSNVEVESEYKANIDRLMQVEKLLSISKTSSMKLTELTQFKGKVFCIGGSGFSIGEVSNGEDLKVRSGILCVASDSPHKNVEKLVQSYALLSKEIQSRHNLVIVGIKNSTEKSRLRNIAKELGTSIVLLDSISDSDLTKLYTRSRISVLPSFSEGLGMPVIESWHNGCVSLGSKQTAISEVLSSEDVTFTPESTLEIFEKMHKYLIEDAIWHKEQNRVMLEREKHTWEKVGLEVKKLLNPEMLK